MVGLIAFGNPDNSVTIPKVYVRKINLTYQIYGTVTNPATETMSMGLPADARAVKFFLQPHFPNLSWRDNFVPSTGTCKKLASPDTDGNSPYHRAVSTNISECDD